MINTYNRLSTLFRLVKLAASEAAEVERPRPPGARAGAGTPRGRAWRFSLSTLLALVTGTCLLLATWKYSPCWALLLFATCLWTVAHWPAGLSASRPAATRAALSSFVAAVVCVGLLEAMAAAIAWHTRGEIHRGLRDAAILLNLAWLAAYGLGWRRLAVMGVLALGLVLVPWELMLGMRWLALRSEAERIVSHVTNEWRATGRKPKDLAGYQFRHPELVPHIIYFPGRTGSFQVEYWVASPTTSHSYSPEQGWQYHPD